MMWLKNFRYWCDRALTVSRNSTATTMPKKISRLELLAASTTNSTSIDKNRAAFTTKMTGYCFLMKHSTYYISCSLLWNFSVYCVKLMFDGLSLRFRTT